MRNLIKPILLLTFFTATVSEARTLVFKSKKEAEEQCATVKYIGPVMVSANNVQGVEQKRAMLEELLKKSLEKKGTAVYLLGGKKNRDGVWIMHGISIICVPKPTEEAPKLEDNSTPGISFPNDKT